MYKQIETRASATLNNGVTITPVATLTDGYGIAHIWIDDHCYVLGLERVQVDTSIRVDPMYHWFAEACEVLKTLPSPAAPQKPQELGA